MSEIAGWDSFYVILGSAAGALIGLQFVVMTLITERPSLRAAEAGAAFATPNVVHFGTVLLLAALLRAPWRAAIAIATFSALIGLAGMAYELIVARRMRRQDTYPPELEDWFFYLGLPLTAYTGLAASAFAVFSHMREALFGIGASTLLLLFLGIRNAWDSIAYHVLVSRSRQSPERSPADGGRLGGGDRHGPPGGDQHDQLPQQGDEARDRQELRYCPPRS